MVLGSMNQFLIYLMGWGGGEQKLLNFSGGRELGGGRQGVRGCLEAVFS